MSVEALAAAAEGVAGRKLPPVHLWNPERSGEIDIRIARSGAWYHEGDLIRRDALVSLFSTILRRDPDGFWLVTPAEKLRIAVEDAPFIAVGLARASSGLRFTTNVGDTVEAGPDHPLRVAVDPSTDEPHPYIHVRGGLEARLSRPVFYELVESGEARGDQFGVVSNGVWFPLGRVD